MRALMIVFLVLALGSVEAARSDDGILTKEKRQSIIDDVRTKYQKNMKSLPDEIKTLKAAVERYEKNFKINPQAESLDQQPPKASAQFRSLADRNEELKKTRAKLAVATVAKKRLDENPATAVNPLTDAALKVGDYGWIPEDNRVFEKLADGRGIIECKFTFTEGAAGFGRGSTIEMRYQFTMMLPADSRPVVGKPLKLSGIYFISEAGPVGDRKKSFTAIPIDLSKEEMEAIKKP